ncbi:MAG TPA: hypothetical protein VIQ25_16185 [Gemmatimonadales bacterium]
MRGSFSSWPSLHQRTPEWSFEAYLEASIVFARAAVHRLKAKHEKHPAWKQWWDSLSGNQAVEFFRTERDWLLKEAPPKVGQRVFMPFIGHGGTGEPAYVPVRAAEFYYFETPGTPATDTVAKHLDALATLLTDGERQFT